MAFASRGYKPLATNVRPPGEEMCARCLRLVERAAIDESRRAGIKKAVSWALRRIGRRNLELNAAAVTVAKRLFESPKEAARWVGKDALRKLTSAAVVRRLAARRRAAAGR